MTAKKCLQIPKAWEVASGPDIGLKTERLQVQSPIPPIIFSSSPNSSASGWWSKCLVLGRRQNTWSRALLACVRQRSWGRGPMLPGQMSGATITACFAFLVGKYPLTKTPSKNAGNYQKYIIYCIKKDFFFSPLISPFFPHDSFSFMLYGLRWRHISVLKYIIVYTLHISHFHPPFNFFF